MRRALALALILSSASAAAQKKPSPQDLSEARKHFDRGQAAHDAARYDEAIREYQAAYDLSHRPLLLFNLAQAQRLRGDRQAAVELYQKYLAAEPNGRAAVEAKAFASALLREIQLEELAISRRASDDEWRGAAEGAAPAPRLAAEAPAPVAAGFGVRDEAPVDRGRGLRTAGLVSGGAGLAIVGAGVFFSLRARSLDNKQYEVREWDPDRAADIVADGRSANRNAIVCFVAGGAALATGGVLYFLGRRRAAERRVAVVPIAVPGEAGLTVWARF